jgi:hypothetical protein
MVKTLLQSLGILRVPPREPTLPEVIEAQLDAARRALLEAAADHERTRHTVAMLQDRVERLESAAS